MSLVNVLNVIAKQSKTPFLSNISFDIYFESVRSLKHSLTWRIIYIGQAANDEYDQILEEAEMDCEVAGRMQFTLDVSKAIIYNKDGLIQVIFSIICTIIFDYMFLIMILIIGYTSRCNKTSSK